MSGNPARKSIEYKRNRAILRARGDPCARCGGEIDYASPRYSVVNGRRRENPWSYDCGHVVAVALGGTEELSNLQAEHVRCSRTSGGRLGLSLRFGARTTGSSTAAMWRRW
jgi:hypothetical protein